MLTAFFYLHNSFLLSADSYQLSAIGIKADNKSIICDSGRRVKRRGFFSFESITIKDTIFFFARLLQDEADSSRYSISSDEAKYYESAVFFLITGGTPVAPGELNIWLLTRHESI